MGNSLSSYVKILVLLLSAMVLLCGYALAGTPQLKPHRIEISYVKPQNPAHQQLYDLVRERRLLERFRDYLSHLYLPAPLLLKTEGCDGVSNAWYESSDHSVTVCYEYLEELQKFAPVKTTPGGVTTRDAVYGPTVEVFFHEVSHALFDMLKIPILGREEDAADMLAGYVMLAQDEDVARKTVSSVVFMYGREAQSENLNFERFADVHGLTAQRLYNLLCLAYGANPKLFADVVEKGYLPKSRAEGCSDEYKQIVYAAETLLGPYSDDSMKKDVTRKKLLRPEAPK